MKFGDFELGKYRFKQEEIGSTLLAATMWIWVFDFFLPIKDSFFRAEKMYMIVSNIMALSLLLLLFMVSNRQTFRCYYLTRNKRVIMRAKVEKERVWGTKASVYMAIQFKILETRERYWWKESFSTFPSMPLLEILRFLETLPEIDVLVALDNHADNYPFIEVAFDEFVRQSQKMFRVLNVFWLLLFVVSVIYVFGIYFELM